MIITEKEAIADKGKSVARRETEIYFSRCTLLPGETEKDFHELNKAELPKPIDPPPAPSLEETVEQQAAEIADLKAALNALLERRVQ